MDEKPKRREKREKREKGEPKESVFKRADLSNALIEKTGLPRAKATTAVDAMLETITERLKEAKEVRLVGFGAFVLSKRKAGKGRDPRTGSEIDIGEATSVRFRPSKALRDAVSGKQAAPAAAATAHDDADLEDDED